MSVVIDGYIFGPDEWFFRNVEWEQVAAALATAGITPDAFNHPPMVRILGDPGYPDGFLLPMHRTMAYEFTVVDGALSASRRSLPNNCEWTG